MGAFAPFQVIQFCPVANSTTQLNRSQLPKALRASATASVAHVDPCNYIRRWRLRMQKSCKATFPCRVEKDDDDNDDDDEDDDDDDEEAMMIMFSLNPLIGFRFRCSAKLRKERKLADCRASLQPVPGE